MSADPKLFRINPDTHESKAMNEVDFAQLGLRERQDIQEWIAANPGILGDDLLIISKEFSGFDRTAERLDLLAVDKDARLVVIELKRDDTGADVHWQAIKYASYLNRVDADGIIRMFTAHEEMEKADAMDKLLQHLDSNDPNALNALNNDQRIILASHRFAPEVTSAALWLNEKVPGKDLITCIQLTPYQDEKTDSLYIQVNTIIPVPGVEDYMIGVGDYSNEASPLAQEKRNSNDEVTYFLREVAERVVEDLPDGLKPDKKSRWAGGGPSWRCYHLWYSQSHWGNWDMTYYVHLFPQNEDASDRWQADVGFAYWKSEIKDLEDKLAGLQVYDDQRLYYKPKEFLVLRYGNALDDSFADTLTNTLKRFIEVITPLIEQWKDEGNEEDA